MTRTHWPALGPGLIIGAGLLGSTAVAALNMRSVWMAAAAAGIFAASLLGADVLRRYQRGDVPRPTAQAMLLAGAFCVACGMLAAADPTSVAMMIPILGGGVAAPLLTGRAGTCCTRRAITGA